MEYKGLLEKLTVPQLVKKFPGLFVIRGVITSFTRARHLSISWARLIQSMSPFPFLKNRFIIMLTYKPESSKLSPAPVLSHQIPECTSPLLILATWSVHHFLFDFITQITFGEEYRLKSSSLWSLLHSLITSFFYLSSSESNPRTPSTCIHPSIWQTKSHSHTKQQERLLLWIFWSSCFWIVNWKTKDSAPNIRNTPCLQSALDCASNKT